MSPEEAERLGAGVIASYLQWEAGLPRQAPLDGDRARLLCNVLLVPHVSVRLPLLRMRPNGEVDGSVWMPASTRRHPLTDDPVGGMPTLVQIGSPDLILAATIVLAVHRLDETGREADVPTELRAASSIGMMLGLEVRREGQR